MQDLGAGVLAVLLMGREQTLNQKFGVWYRLLLLPDGSLGKESACNAGDPETQVWSLGQEDPLEKEMATHASILAWKSLWVEEPGRLQSKGLHRVRHNWATKHTHCYSRVIPDWGCLGKCRSHILDTNLGWIFHLYFYEITLICTELSFLKNVI